MINCHRVIALGLMLTLSGPAQAVGPNTTSITTTGTATASEQYSNLSKSERTRARRWDLSEAEWLRYRQLMGGVRGSVSPETISPIEVLGIHARDVTERQKYAERWAQMMHEDADRILAFQHAYDDAIRRLYPDERLIDPSLLPKPSENTGRLAPGDRVLFFTRVKCPACDALFDRLVQKIDTLAGIDVYLMGDGNANDQAVREWARQRGIKPGWVRTRRVTLNHDAGALEQLTQGKGEVPYLMRRHGEAVSQLRAADL